MNFQPIKIKTLALSVAGIVAVTGIASSKEIDSACDAALRQMSDKLVAAQTFTIKANRTLDEQLTGNPAAIGDADLEASVIRPDRVKAVIVGKDNERHFYLGKDGSAVFTKNPGFYARFPGKATIDESLDAASAELGIHIPIQDFLCLNPYEAFTREGTKVSHTGSENAGGQDCDRVKGVREDLTWELWIAKSDHLPRRMTITVAGLEGENHFQADIEEWNLDAALGDDDLKFTPPEGSHEIEFLPPEEWIEEGEKSEPAP